MDVVTKRNGLGYFFAMISTDPSYSHGVGIRKMGTLEKIAVRDLNMQR
jgi:hypothetical protein